MSEFIHLHNHSHYSLLDAISSIDGLVDAAVENNMPAVALDRSRCDVRRNGVL